MAANGLPTHTTISGATATTGVTCNITAQGCNAARAHVLAAIAHASATPTTHAASNAAAVTDNVATSACSKLP